MQFSRAERLKSEKLITHLFKEGHSFSCYPLRLVWLEIDTKEWLPLSKSPVLFTLSIPKKNFKKASQRNILRRRLREAYRLHKKEIYDFLANNESFSNKQYAFMAIYVAKETCPLEEIENGIFKMIKKFKMALQNNGL